MTHPSNVLVRGADTGEPVTGLPVINPGLFTDRLYMRPLVRGDVDVVVDLFSHGETVRYTGGQTCSRAEIEEQMPLILRRSAGGRIGVWCVMDRQDGAKYGTAMLLPLPDHTDQNHTKYEHTKCATDWDMVTGHGMPSGPVEIGYLLKRSAWGRGIATEAASRLLRFAFEETRPGELDGIVACADRGHVASRRVLQKIGLRQTGTMFRISREQWQEKHGLVEHGQAGKIQHNGETGKHTAEGT